MVDDQPKWRTGKICYIEIPAAEVARSAEFYQRAFGWRMMTRDGATSFDDTVGQVSGTFVTGRPPATEPGFGIYIMVADVRAALDAIAAAGGKTVHLGRAGDGVFALFSDPAGNILGIYQPPGLAEAEEENQHG